MRLYPSAIHKETGRFFKFVKRFPFNLADSLSGYIKVFPHFFQSSGLSIVQPKAKFKNLTFPVGQGVQQFINLFSEQNGAGRFIGGNGFMILNEISQMGIFLFTNRCFQ